MENSIYTAEYFIKKFEAIRDDMWLTLDQGTVEDHGNYAHCAIGWCKNDVGYYGNSSWDSSTEAKCLTKLFLSIGLKSMATSEDGERDSGWNVANVNNGDEPRYKQPTPKQRILAALYDIYEKTYGRKYGDQEQPKEKVIYKTVVIDSAVKELQETLTEN